MVTFICGNCDQTLKKNQVERHLYQCRYSPSLICIDCNKVFSGNQHKAHTSCISEQEKTMGQYYKPKKKPQNGNNNAESATKNKELGSEEAEKISQEKWVGWKKTIRKTLQKEKKFEMKIPKLKEIILKDFLSKNKGLNSDVEEIFNEKIKNYRFQIKGDMVKYIPKKERESKINN